MRYRIFKRMLSVGVVFIVAITFIICLGSFLFFRHSLVDSMKHEARTVAAFWDNVEEDSRSWEQLMTHRDENYRLTIIDPSGVVLYESARDKEGMENHGQRPEVMEAFQDGESSSERTSATLGYASYYYAVKSPSGNVVRIAAEASSLDSYLYGAFLISFIIALLYITFIYYLAKHITADLVKPIDEAFRGWTHKRGRKVLRRLSQTYIELDPLVTLLEKQQDELDRYVDEETKRRREFSSNIAHELKTPLTTISGYAELLKEGYFKSGKEASALGTKIYAASKNMLETIENILHLSEVEAHMWESMLVSVDMKDIWKRAWATVEQKYPGAKVHFSLEGDAKPVKGHTSLLLEMATNLLENAIKYGKENNHIRLFLEDDGDMTYMRLSDEGIGIPEDQHDRIFERFYRVDASRNKGIAGTGIGLSLVKHIVEIHHGMIRVESKEGEGTTFIVELPHEK